MLPEQPSFAAGATESECFSLCQRFCLCAIRSAAVVGSSAAADAQIALQAAGQGEHVRAGGGRTRGGHPEPRGAAAAATGHRAAGHETGGVAGPHVGRGAPPVRCCHLYFELTISLRFNLIRGIPAEVYFAVA